MLRTRVLTALVLVPLVLAALFLLDARAWGVATLVIVGIGAAEWARLASLSRTAAYAFIALLILMGVSLLWSPIFDFQAGRGWPDALVLAVCGAATLFWLLVVPAWLVRGWRPRPPALHAAVGLLVLLSTWIAIVQIHAHSPGLLLALMAVVWVADTAAYFAGRRFGRHKLAPSISPGKTREGAYGALFAVGAYALALLPLGARNGYAQAIGAGAAAGWVVLLVLLALLSIFGDLFESLLKRQRGVKDSGSVLPGHGGVLDRIDALTAAMPAAALIVNYLVR